MKATFCPPAKERQETSLLTYASSVMLYGFGDDGATVNGAATKSIREFLELPVTMQIFRTEESLRSILRRHHSQLSTKIFRVVDGRISTLLDPAEWDDAVVSPDVESFAALVSYLADNPRLKAPSIFMGQNGSFDANWRPSKDRLVSLVFQSEGAVSWLVFVPREDHDEGTEEARGRCAVDKVNDRLKGFGALEWMES